MKGVSGVILKPVTGFLDAASKLSEGVQNCLKITVDGPNNVKSRVPRAFYEPIAYFKSYSAIDAIFVEAASKNKRVSSPVAYFFECFEGIDIKRHEPLIIALTYDNLSLYKPTSATISTIIPLPVIIDSQVMQSQGEEIPSSRVVITHIQQEELIPL